MFGFTRTAQSTAIALSVALAAGTGFASVSTAAPIPAGNSIELPLAVGGGCHGGNTYDLQMPDGKVVPMACPGTTHQASVAFYSGRPARGERSAAPAVVASANPMMACVGGYTWRYKVAGEWDTLPIRCGS